MSDHVNPLAVEARDWKLQIDPREEEVLVTFTDKTSGRSVENIPLMRLHVHDKALRRTLRVEKYRTMWVEPVPGGARVMVIDEKHGLELALWLREREGELSVVLVPHEVYERDDRLFRLFGVDLLPGLMRVHGELLAPLITGVRAATGSLPAFSDRFLLYGEQDRWEIVPTLPICASREEAGGLVCLALKGAPDTLCRVSADGEGAGEISFNITLRRLWIDPVETGLREYRFSVLPKDENMLLAAGRRLRRHVLEDCGKKTLRERTAESPEVAYLMKAIIVKLFFGIEHVGYLASSMKVRQPGSFQRYMSFAEALESLKTCKQLGIDGILTEMTGWNTRGHDGQYPMRLPVEERLGGEEGFRELIREGNAMGYHMHVHNNFMMLCAGSPETDLDKVVMDQFGEPLIHGCWAGGVEYCGWPLAYDEEDLQGHAHALQALGMRGMSYVDYMEQPLEVNYHPKHRGTRADCARGQIRVLEAMREVFGAAGTEMGFFPCSVAADCITNPGKEWHMKMCDPSWPIMQLHSHGELVPLWQLVFSGLTLCEAAGGPSWANAMDCVLYGRILREEYSTHPGLMPVFDDQRAKALKAAYDLCAIRFGHLKELAITDYQADGPQRKTTVFEDGTEVRADFAAGTLAVDGESIPCPPEMAKK